MNIETRKISDLHHAGYNPRKKLTPSDAEYQKYLVALMNSVTLWTNYC